MAPEPPVEDPWSEWGPPHLHQSLFWELRGLKGHGAPHVGGDGVCGAEPRAGRGLQGVHAGARVGVEAGEGPHGAGGAGGAWRIMT